MNQELRQVLEARELRWQRRLALVEERGSALVTITLCLPVAYRTSPEFGMIFRKLCRRFCALLRSHRFHYHLEGFLDGADGPAFLLTTTRDAAQLKRLCIGAEESFGGGRMLDIDVMDPAGEPLGRAQVGFPPRRCFVCQEDAAVCVSQKAHTTQELALRVAQLRAEALAYLLP